MSNQEQKPSFSLKAKTQTTTYPNGTKEHYSFNINKELIALDTAEQTYSYQRDALGRITSINSVQGTQLQNNESNTEYSYDVLGQLIQAGSETFEYDKAGNNQHKQSTYDTSMNQLLEDTQYRYTYDAKGNLHKKIDKQTNHLQFYRYNDFNQLVEHYKADETDQYLYRLRYSYDGFGRRITKTYVDSQDNTKSYAHHYLYHNQNIIAILDLNHNKQLLATIVHHPSQVDTPLSITNHTTNKTYYYHRDHQGSIVALTNEEGNTVESIEYDGHYGTILNHTQEEETFNPYGYTGREIDTKDLYYYRARYYDPTTQRFLSRDPIEFEAGDFNFYRYVSNDPVNFVDPSGLDWESALANKNEASFGKTLTGFKDGLMAIGDYMARIMGIRDIQEGSVILGKYHQEKAWEETKEAAELACHIVEHPKLALDAYAEYNKYNKEQMDMDFTLKGLSTIFASGFPFIISSIGNLGTQAGKLNTIIKNNLPSGENE